MRRFTAILIVGLALAIYLIFSQYAWKSRSLVRQETKAGYVLPSKFSRILALGNKGLLSDFQFLELTTFWGGRILHGGNIKEEDWRYFISSVESITDLDPYFLDPYLLAEGFLTWEARQYEEANRLLEKGVENRTWDWNLPYFVGFNYFYFLHDYKNGANYVMKASKIHGAPGFLPTLASRLAYYGGKTKTAVLFLKGLLFDTKDPYLRKSLQLRLLALERAELIEEAVQKFKEDHGRLPKTKELVNDGYLDEMPIDPYGGEWGILKNGRVFSTSKFVEEKEKVSNLHSSKP